MIFPEWPAAEQRQASGGVASAATHGISLFQTPWVDKSEIRYQTLEIWL